MSDDPNRPDERIAHPNRGTLGQPPMGGGDHLYLSAQQLADREDGPSWRPPRRGMGTGSLIALIVAAGIAVILVLWALGVIF